MGRIHPDAERAYFAFHPLERDIVGPFLSGFDVTRAFRKQRGRGEVAAFYLKPERFIAEMLGLEHEILAVYAPYGEFLDRTIQLHDEIAAEDRVRLDPIGSIIISDAPDVNEAVKDHLARDPERPPIVAVSADVLSRVRDANALRGLLLAQLFKRDLFAVESPLHKDTTFFGRSGIVTELIDRFRSGQNSGLFGLRRIGKSSVLYAAGRKCSVGSIGGSVYLDSSSPALYGSRWWEVLQAVIEAFCGPLKLDRGKRTKVRALSTTYAEADGARHFKADVVRLLDYYSEGRLLLMMDEIEHLTFDISPAQHWQTDFLPFWQTLRSVHQDTQGAFCFMIAGVNPHILESERVGKYDNPIFSAVKGYYLGPFDVTTVRDMIRRLGRYMGLRCEEPLYQRLTEEYGGHPFLIRQACSHLAKQVDERPGEVTCSLFERERERIAISLEKNIRQILNVLAQWYPDEYELICLLARGDKATFVEFARESAQFTAHVEGYGIVKDARGAAKIGIGLAKRYLSRISKESVDAEAPATDIDAILAEISRRRNRIERGLRKVLRDGLKFAHGKRAAAQALSCLPEKRRELIAGYGYEKLWGELYFGELIPIVGKFWGAFEKWFSEEKDKVLQWLDHINRSRADAHARALSEDDLAFLRVCFRRLEERLPT